jgi:hypothetical protein
MRTPQKRAGKTASCNGRRIVGNTLASPELGDCTRHGTEEDRWADVLLAKNQYRPEAVPLEKIEPALAAVTVTPSTTGNGIEKCDNEGAAARLHDPRQFCDSRILITMFQVMNNGDRCGHLDTGGLHGQGGSGGDVKR